MSSLREEQVFEYWSSLEQLTQATQADARSGASPESTAKGALNRRQFARLMSASLGLAGLAASGCRRWPEQEIRPHTQRPPLRTPGVPVQYATCFDSQGVATGILVTSYDGRPIKVEGNPVHPFSSGAADVFAQASVLELYDPQRSQRVMRRAIGVTDAERVESSWDEFARFAVGHFRELKRREGSGLAVLAAPSDSPTLGRLRGELQAGFPRSRWFQYQPVHRDFDIAGSRAAFGRALRCQYRLDRAEVIASFDSDFLGSHPARLRLAADWVNWRRSAPDGTMNRLWVIESTHSLTGSNADVRLPVRSTRVGLCLQYVAARLGVETSLPTEISQVERDFCDRLIRDLSAAGAASIVLAGPAQPAGVHALIHAVNHALGNWDNTLGYTDEPQAEMGGCLESITELSQALRGKVFDTLLILGGNPVYDAPADVPLLPSSPSQLTTIHLGPYDDETAERCQWHLPMAHYLECWGDGRAWDGTYSVQQPLILPLHGGRSAIELLAQLLEAPPDGLSMVRRTAQSLWPEMDDRRWQTLLHDGLLEGSQYTAVQPPRPQARAVEPAAESDWEVCFVPDSKVFDGRYANNPWLQELPDSMTKLTWDNAALISPRDADVLGVKTGDLVSLQIPDAPALQISAYVLPGQAAGCVTLPLGYGRWRAGHIGSALGFNTYRVRRSDGNYVATGATLAKTAGRYPLASTQEHHLMDRVGRRGMEQRVGLPGRSGSIVHESSLQQYLEHPEHLHGEHHEQEAPMFNAPSTFNRPHAWGMSIDLTACIGCNACVVACQAENNIPVVGKHNVANHREMHWLRIDRYFKGDVDQPDVVHLPMACVQCENAPCEQVCPVAATVHDSEGLNAMVYNRCVGTRYCANNCPYKTRRFNFFDYQSADPRSPAQPWLGIPDRQPNEEISPLRQLAFNPEVTVRMRGVMEKCTYCVQRIAAARIRAKLQHAGGARNSSQVADGEVVTACQATCPTQAIVFGDLNDAGSQVSRAQVDPRAYSILGELNVRPRTRYLAKIRNPDRPQSEHG